MDWKETGQEKGRRALERNQIDKTTLYFQNEEK
jgi:hypothetical protein